MSPAAALLVIEERIREAIDALCSARRSEVRGDLRDMSAFASAASDYLLEAAELISELCESVDNSAPSGG